MSLKIGPDDQHQDILANNQKDTQAENQKEKANKHTCLGIQAKKPNHFYGKHQTLIISVKICKINAYCRLVIKSCPTLLQPQRL